MTKEEKENIANQLIPLVKAFYKKYNISKYITNNTNKDSEDYKSTINEFYNEFVSISLEHLICKTRIFDTYNEKRSSLSTFVFMVLKQNYLMFVQQAKYNISTSSSRKIIKELTKYDDENSNEEKNKSNLYNSLINFYSPISYDMPAAEDDDSRSDSDSIINSLISDNIESIESNLEQKDYIKRIFEYVNTEKSITETQRKYFLHYVFVTQNYTTTAKYFNVSKQAVYDACNKIRRKIKKSVAE